jgi:hypothetical protein
LKTVEIAMRSCAAPILLPIHNGFLDGSLYATNPSMSAIVLLLQYLPNSSMDSPADEKLPIDKAWRRLAEIKLLSVGTGLSPTYIKDANGDWGYLRWLADPTHPLALVDMLLQAGADSVDMQARGLLGKENYQRLDVVLSKPISPTTHITRDQIDAAEKDVQTLRLQDPRKDPVERGANTPAGELTGKKANDGDHTLVWLNDADWGRLPESR